MRVKNSGPGGLNTLFPSALGCQRKSPLGGEISARWGSKNYQRRDLDVFRPPCLFIRLLGWRDCSHLFTKVRKFFDIREHKKYKG